MRTIFIKRNRRLFLLLEVASDIALAAIATGLGYLIFQFSLELVDLARWYVSSKN